jgi:hypothetical protein
MLNVALVGVKFYPTNQTTVDRQFWFCGKVVAEPVLSTKALFGF